MKAKALIILSIITLFFLLCAVQDREQDLNRLRARNLKLEREIEHLKSNQIKNHIEMTKPKL